MLVIPDWYVCLSVAINAEEQEQHTRQYIAYVSAGGDPKKFPKLKRPHLVPAERRPDVNPHDIIMNAISTSKVQIGGVKGNVGEYAKARGLQKVYQMPDGTFVNEDGERVEPTAGSVFVRSKRGQ